MLRNAGLHQPASMVLVTFANAVKSVGRFLGGDDVAGMQARHVFNLAQRIQAMPFERDISCSRRISGMYAESDFNLLVGSVVLFEMRDRRTIILVVLH